MLCSKKSVRIRKAHNQWSLHRQFSAFRIFGDAIPTDGDEEGLLEGSVPQIPGATARTVKCCSQGAW